MFSKFLTSGIGALALVQGALAIAEGTYLIVNGEGGSLFSFGRGQPVTASNGTVLGPLMEWTVKQSGQDEYTITSAEDLTVYTTQDTLLTGDHVDTYSIKDGGNDGFGNTLFVIGVPHTDRVWTAGQTGDVRVHLNPDEGRGSQKWDFLPADHSSGGPGGAE